MMACQGGDFGPDTVSDPFIPQIGSPRPGGDGDLDGVLLDIQPHLAVPDKHDRPYVTFHQTVNFNRVEDGLLDLGRGVRDLDLNNMSRGKEPIDMVRKTEDRRASIPFVAPYPLKDSKTVVQTMGQDMNGGLFPIDKAA